MSRRRQELLHRYLLWEHALTQSVNRISAFPPMRWLFGTASRLGNWAGWFVILLLMLVLRGGAAVLPIAWMLLTAVIGIGLYWSIKRLAARPRPSVSCDSLRLSEPPLDQFSFPSGHTLHAVSFSVVALAWFPVLAPLLLTFTLLVAASRVVLGLHYPSDVLAAIAIGLLLGGAALALGPAQAWGGF